MLGVGVGTWIGSSADYAALVASDERPRPPTGEARLIMDQGLEQFGRRLPTSERATAPVQIPVGQRAVQPTRMDAPPSRARQDSEGS
jgi:hypothetical protein